MGLQKRSAAWDLQAIDHLVTPAVIGAADFDDVLFLGSDTGDTHGSHDRLRAAAQHTEHLLSLIHI